MLKKLHQAHQGGESMVRRTREVMYWPGMQAAIIQKVSIAHYVPATVQRTLKNQCCLMEVYFPRLIQAERAIVCGYSWPFQ